MKKYLFLIFVLFAFVGCTESPAPTTTITPTETPTDNPTVTPTATPIPTVTPTPTSDEYADLSSTLKTYYNNALYKSGSELKSALHNIIDGHTQYPYSSSSTDVWDILKVADRDPNNSNNVILIYSGWSKNAAREYDGGNGWNREHVWAKSHGDFGESPGAGTDAHHLRASDISVNSARGNRWFDEIEPGVNGYEYIDGDGATGSYTSEDAWIWEPRAEVKGDVARMMFYMAVRYEGDVSGEPDLELVDYIPTDNNTAEPIHAKLCSLLDWHIHDAVSSFEKNRNNVVESYQHNRNPFIDHPNWAIEIWGPSCNL